MRALISTLLLLLACGEDPKDTGASTTDGVCDPSSDQDGDGLDDCTEAELGTDPSEPDSDGDGVSDGEELDCVSDPLDPEEQCYACGWAHNDPGDLRYLLGDGSALSPDSRAGMEFFQSTRLGCSGCHGGLFLDRPADATGDVLSETPEYANTGMYDIDGAGGYPPHETGLHARTGDPADMGRFRVPSLRGVADTGPWGHDGSFPSLGAVLDAYARGGRLLVGGPFPGDGAASPLKDPRITGFSMSETEKLQLLAFLGSLTDPGANARPFLQTPWCPEEPDTGDAGCIPVEG